MLVNTSGAGKTRLLLDGLCHMWGFYFVGSNDADGIGSSDLDTFVKELDDAAGYSEAYVASKSDKDKQAGFDHIQSLTRRRFLQLLLARFLLLNLLIKEAKESGGLRPKEHRRLWVYLQVLPRNFDKTLDGDLFLVVARELQFTSSDDLKDRISEQYKQLRGDLDDVVLRNGTIMKRPVYCIVDEAQGLSLLRGDQFLSIERDLGPVLRELYLALTNLPDGIKMRLIFSGTGVEASLIDKLIPSKSFKPKRWNKVSDIGAFDDVESQKEYIQQYIPAPWSEPCWKEFLVRAFAWFRGR
jgi:hypothetical protein